MPGGAQDTAARTETDRRLKQRAAVPEVQSGEARRRHRLLFPAFVYQTGVFESRIMKKKKQSSGAESSQQGKPAVPCEKHPAARARQSLRWRHRVRHGGGFPVPQKNLLE